MTIKTITRHVWHVFDDSGKRLGWIRRHDGERATLYVAHLDEDPIDEALFQTFEQAEGAFAAHLAAQKPAAVEVEGVRAIEVD